MSAPWINHRGHDLQQGDVLPDCVVPIIPEEFGLEAREAEVDVEIRTLIVVTQSCDLQSQRSRFAALCPIYRRDEFETVNPDFARRGRWEEVRKGRCEGLHMLFSPEDPSQNQLVRVVDFRHILSLPIPYLERHAEEIGDRWRLQSPYVEHFSQSFARFFMRVGLPLAIPAFH